MMTQLLVVVNFVLAVLIGLFGRSVGRSGTMIALAINGILSIYLSSLDYMDYINAKEEASSLLQDWITEGIQVRVIIYIGSKNLFFSSIVIGIASLVQFYSTSYMRNDAHLIRFMTYLSLFTAFMLLFVNSYNLVTLFIGWEGIGIMSGLLVSYWYNQDNSIRSALKAMFVNRIGDYALSLALFIGLGESLTSDFNTLDANHLELFGLLLLIGLVAKSAQLLLHTWLPDAMAAPTPVSSLLHAATMVTAGLFLLFRFSNGEYLGSNNLYLTLILLVLSGITSVLAGSIGQNLSDIKKIIAFSTCSQLGIIAVALALTGLSTALFHLYTHAIFKALLFLGAGSVIHSLNDYQDLRFYGSLYNIVPLTVTTMITGSVALSGLPFLAGFYSKDSILDFAYLSLDFLSLVGFWSITVATLFTGFYSFYSIFMISFGQPSSSYSSYSNAHESDMVTLTPLILLGVGSIVAGTFYLSDNYSLLLASVDRSLHFFIYSLIPSIAGLIGLLLANFINYIKPVSYFNLLNAKYYWDRLNHLYTRYTLEASHSQFLISDKYLDEGNLFSTTYFTSRSSKIILRRFINSDYLTFAYMLVLMTNLIVLTYLYI